MTGEGTYFAKGIYRGFSPKTANMCMTVCREKGVEARIETVQSFDSLEYRVRIHGRYSWEKQDEIRKEVEKRLGYSIWSYLYSYEKGETKCT